MSQPVVYVDISTVLSGRLQELEASMKRLTTFVETNMPRLISYGFFLDETQTRMTVVAVHPDSSSLESHLSAGSAEFQKFADLIHLSRIDVYGRVSDTVIESLMRKAQALGGGTVAVHQLYAGFAR